jgi:hypothetical protein
MTFTPEQVSQLLKPINNARVLADGKGHAHVSQQDILAHLIRVFGFGGFDIEVLAVECVFEQGRTPEPVTRYDVCYRALVRLTVKDASGTVVCTYENGSTATAQNQSRGDAHDLAYKSAISLSVKRAAIALGDQFGLSLYNKGQRTALVMGTMVGGKPNTDPWSSPTKAAPSDIQDGVAQQVAMGNDETDLPLEGEQKAERIKATPPDDPYYDAPPRATGDRQATTAQVTAVRLAQERAGVTDREQALAEAAEMVGRPIQSRNDLTRSEASMIVAAYKAKAAR